MHPAEYLDMQALGEDEKMVNIQSIQAAHILFLKQILIIWKTENNIFFNIYRKRSSI